MTFYQECQVHLSQLRSSFRKLERLLNHPDFEDATLRSTEAELQEVMLHIRFYNYVDLKQWIIDKKVEGYSVKTLRQIAKTYNISKWHLLNKDELLQEIKIARTIVRNNKETL